jgi:hypothetical protein
MGDGSDPKQLADWRSSHIPLHLCYEPSNLQAVEHQGEADIVEGVNESTENQSTLHTSPGCSMPDADQITMTG